MTNDEALMQEFQRGSRAAFEELFARYRKPLYGFFGRRLNNSERAEDLTQEFALRFIRGRFRQADPGRGRFRDYVKTSLFNLVEDYRRQERKQPRPLRSATFCKSQRFCRGRPI